MNFDLEKKNSLSPMQPVLNKKAVLNLRPSLYDRVKVAYTRAKTNDVFPTNLVTSHIHRVIIAASSFAFLEGPNGDKGKYVAFNAFGIDVRYKNVTVNSIIAKGLVNQLGQLDMELSAYVAQFPSRVFEKMFRNAVYRSWIDYAENDQVLEIHFKKNNMSDYQLMFLARVEWNQELMRFERKVIDYKDVKYKIPQEKKEE